MMLTAISLGTGALDNKTNEKKEDSLRFVCKKISFQFLISAMHPRVGIMVVVMTFSWKVQLWGRLFWKKYELF